MDDERNNDLNVNMLHMIDDAFDRLDNDDQDAIWGGDLTNANRVDADYYEKLLSETQKVLYPGCVEYTVLTYIVELMHNKVDNHMINKEIDRMLGMMKKMCPNPNNVPESFCVQKDFERSWLGLSKY